MEKQYENLKTKFPIRHLQKKILDQLGKGPVFDAELADACGTTKPDLLQTYRRLKRRGYKIQRFGYRGVGKKRARSKIKIPRFLIYYFEADKLAAYKMIMKKYPIISQHKAHFQMIEEPMLGDLVVHGMGGMKKVLE